MSAVLRQLAVQEAWEDVPAEYELVSQRKGYKRYKSPRLVELLREHAAAQEQREAALSGVLQVRVPTVPHTSFWMSRSW